MIYLNNFDLLKEREQLYNTCSSYVNILKQVKFKKESSEIKQISIILIEETLERDKHNDIQ